MPNLFIAGDAGDCGYHSTLRRRFSSAKLYKRAETTTANTRITRNVVNAMQ
jgi:hypothetical protein